MLSRLVLMVLITVCVLEKQNRALALENLVAGDSETILSENAELLKSIVRIDTLSNAGLFNGKIFKPVSTCSATLVGKNILLTARHCVDHFDVTKTFKINGNDNYQAIKHIIPEKMITKIGDKKVLTDAALVLFTAVDCAKSTIKEIGSIPLASRSDGRTYSNEVILAGYGLTDWLKLQGASEVIHAGKNTWIKSNYGSLSNDLWNQFARRISPDKLKQINFEGLFSLSEGETKGIYQAKKGEKVFSGNVKFLGPALSLQGDSGSSALAIDDQGQYKVVGVASLLFSLSEDQQIEVRIKQPNTKLLYTFKMNYLNKGWYPFKNVMDLLVGPFKLMMGQLKNELERYGLVKDDRFLTDFTVSLNWQKLGGNYYTSVQTPEVETFITNGVSQLSSIRDQDSLKFCQ